MSEKMLERMSNNKIQIPYIYIYIYIYTYVCQKMSETASDRMPKDVDEYRSNRMSNYMPEILSIRGGN